jgi:hypothetical protein
MFSVGGWALLIANGLSGAYLGGTGTRDVHGIVDHLPLRRVDLAMLPFALGGLRSGILSALLCGIALVAPRSANTPTPLWLSLIVAATLPILPATIVWGQHAQAAPLRAGVDPAPPDGPHQRPDGRGGASRRPGPRLR